MSINQIYRQCLLNRNLGESKYSNKHLRGKIRAIGDIKTKSTGLKNMPYSRC